ncbi:helix-turn-helix transcriptional regulator [Vagococcus sp. JNUCC 83]
MKIERLISIIMVLLNKKRVSAQELSETFEVSLRTIYRDVDTIDRAGIPIRSIPGVGGGIEIMPNYKIDKNVFSSTELATILIGLSGVSNIVNGANLRNVLSKVKSLVPNESEQDIENQVNQLYVDLTPWMAQKSIQHYIETIKKALDEKRVLSFNYIDRHGNEIKREAEPCQFILKNGYWYLQAYCCLRNDFRLFKLNRMSNLVMLKNKFETRQYPKPQLEFDDTFGIEQSNIKLRIHKSIKERFLDFNSDEKFIPDGEEHYIISFPFIENDYYYNIILGFGIFCECIEPKHVRDGIKKRLREMSIMYSN